MSSVRFTPMIASLRLKVRYIGKTCSHFSPHSHGHVYLLPELLLKQVFSCS
jgi:hypothetical protein